MARQDRQDRQDRRERQEGEGVEAQDAIALVVWRIRSRGLDYPTEGLVAVPLTKPNAVLTPALVTAITS
ncbi:MAG: hypothetical protein HOY78_03825 [Saccharothrix sp.]|nr:hypothetical protein [Saccharothrix sp.]